MTMLRFVAVACLLFGCELKSLGELREGREQAQAELPAEEAPLPDENAGAPAPEPMADEEPEPAAPPSEPEPAPDAGVVVAPLEADAAVEPEPAMEPEADEDEADAESDAGVSEEPEADEADEDEDRPAHGLRSLTVTLRGMEDDLHHFTQFRVANEAREFHIMFVIHEGLTSGTYRWELPNALEPGERYSLEFFVDHDESTGPGSYDRPPVDHAWTMPIPAGDDDVELEFDYNEDFVDIEAIAPTPFRSTYLTTSGLGEYRGQLYDVRLIERETGRLVGRQVREIPGDTFELTVGSTTQAGVEYQIDVAVDADGDGEYDHEHDPSWRIFATGTAQGMRPMLDTSSPQVDVGF